MLYSCGVEVKNVLQKKLFDESPLLCPSLVSSVYDAQES